MRDDHRDERSPLRSGDFSSDPRFDPDERFAPISRAETEEHVIEAMHQFVDAGEDGAAFSTAIAVYVRATRARGEPVERVLAILTRLGDRVQDSTRGFATHEPNRFRELILRGVLLAYFGTSSPRTPPRSRQTDD